MDIEKIGDIIYKLVRFNNTKYPKPMQIGGIMVLHYLYRRARGEKHNVIWPDYFKPVDEQKMLERYIIDMKQRLIQDDVKK